jgi:sodium transport system permease protein
MIFTIFKKELKETLRDKKTIMSMIVIPMLLFPILFSVMFKIQHAIEDNISNKPMNIGIVEGTKATNYLASLERLPKEFGQRKLTFINDTATLKKLVESDSLQFGIAFPSNFGELEASEKTISISVFYKMSSIGISEKAEMINNAIFKMKQAERIQKNNINQELLTPYVYNYVNIASNQETIGSLVGGFLPYIFIVFGFVGAMYPCIDLFTGEKERGTFETLLTTPVTRWQIMVGKMGVVVLSGFLAACFTLFGIFLSLNVFKVVDNQEIVSAIYDMFSAKNVVLLLLLLFPLVTFFAGVMIPISTNAKSFKEAQSIITPLNAVFIMIAVIGMIPGVSLNYATAFIPVVNIVLGMKSLLSGHLEIIQLLISFAVMVLLAALAIAFSYKRFDDERNILL